MHIHYLHWLISTGVLIESAFCQPCKVTAGKMVPVLGSNSAVGHDIPPTVSRHLSKPCSEILAYYG